MANIYGVAATANCVFEVQQIKPQGWVLTTNRGRMITPPVVTLAKDGDRVHVPHRQHVLELLGVESRANAGNLFAGVEIKVDLAKAHGFGPG